MAATCAAVALLGVATASAPAQGAPELLGAAESVLKREPQLLPSILGSDLIDELRYADPHEGVDIVEAPEGDSTGDAHLELPMSIPPGRGGVQPDLTLTYDSAGGSGWLGEGWDLDVGSIEVDTAFGVPRYLRDKESESYLLDGEGMFPNAVRMELRSREGSRAEFTRRVENQHELIIRHGDNPTNYWWEVRDKMGGIRWYGATPDLGGPEGTRPDGNPIDEGAVLRGPGGAIFRWALSAQRDVGVNMMRFRYDLVQGERVGEDEDPEGKQLYLREITYTHASAGSGHPEDPAYRVRFLRDDDVDLDDRDGLDERKDVIVDGTGGFLKVTSDLLRRIEVDTGTPVQGECFDDTTDDGKDNPTLQDPLCLREFDRRVKAFDLHYDEGAFGKSLLTRVDQIGSDREVFAHNDVGYFDDVRENDGEYRGFEGETDVDAHDDNALNEVVDLFGFGPSALGSSEGNEGDVHAFLGFSPDGPTKTTAIGGSVAVSGGTNQGVLELLDINGDGKPDKVFREAPGQVRFRLNESDASGMRFGEHTYEVDGLSNLSTDFGVGIDGAVEAYLGGTVQFGIGANVQVGEEYFEDVNNDGLPDFISAGRVYFNHLEKDESGQARIPTFERSSTRTRAPIGVRDASFPPVGELDVITEQQRAGSPLLDTVRRWIAPYAGTIDIDAPVTFDPQPDIRVPRHETYDGDGVRVTIQKAGTELWNAELPEPGDSATPDLQGIAVRKGQAIYFRQQSVDEGVLDQVRWDPEISYSGFSHDDDPGLLDVNRRREDIYTASDDFTLAGRPAQTIPAPFKGTIHYDFFLRKTKVLTDNVHVVLQKNGQDWLRERIEDTELHPDGWHIQGNIDVIGPVDTEDGKITDLLTAKLEVDSDVDLSAIEWRPRMWYVAATDAEGKEVDVFDDEGRPQVSLPVAPAIDTYPTSSALSPPDPSGYQPRVKVTLKSSGAIKGTRAAVVMKTRGGLVSKDFLTIDSSGADVLTSKQVDFDVDETGDSYFIEIAFRDPSAMQTVSEITVEDQFGEPVAFTARYAGPQDYFPLPYRGWGYAGYSAPDAPATAPLDEAAFQFRREHFPDSPPATFDRNSTQNPISGKAFPFVPAELELKAQDGTVTGTAAVWSGGKDTVAGGATFARSSRRGSDDPLVVQQPQVLSAGGQVSAPRLVGITAPSFSLTGGFGFVSGSFGGSPSFGLVDYMDMNGDGYPDVLTPSSMELTGPRGAFNGGDRDMPPGVDCAFSGQVVGCDVTFSVGAGFAGSGVGPKGDSRGQANTPQGAPSSTSKRKLTTGRTYSPDGFTGSTGAAWGFNLGATVGVDAEFTNPSAPDEEWADAIDEIDILPELEADFADVNGDGLPDRVISTGVGVKVQLNLGHDFTHDIDWATGGFETSAAFSGNVGATLGFQWNFKEFAGGLNYNEGVGFAQTTWLDVNGDGILDRLTKKGPEEIKVAFGTGAGLMDEQDYGDFAVGHVELSDKDGIPLGQQIAQDRSRGFGGGVDFTVPIGPLCFPTPLCWILINPGVHFDHSVNNTAVAVVDIDGDGAPDSVSSTDDSELHVRRNRVERTNLLKSVTSSVGREIRLDYRREGNTTRRPQAQWTLASVLVDDNHEGDGKDVQLSTYEYEDGEYDPLERQFLGYRHVREQERDFQDDGDELDDPVLRRTHQEYRNRTVFENGLLTRETVLGPGETRLKESVSEWETVDLESGAPVDAAGMDAQERLGLALAPQRTKLTHRWYDGPGIVGQETWHEFAYDDLGNVVRQVDVGEPEDAHDDLVATITPSTCDISLSEGYKTDNDFACGDRPEAEQVSPLWDAEVCPTWTSIPAVFEVRDGDGKLLVSRNGAPALCDNSSVTELRERTGKGDEEAVTELDYDDWGSYNWIAYPGEHPPYDAADPDNLVHTLAEDGQRVAVHYVYDDHNHAQVAKVTDSHGVTAHADFDPLTGRISSRTDANKQTTTYAYDAAGRLDEIRGPLQQDQDDDPTVDFAYQVGFGTSSATAKHFDAFDSDDPIETAAFADGLGREILTKRDAALHAGIGTAPADRMVVEDAVEFDALGREVKEWYPTHEPLGQATTFNSDHTTIPPTRTSYSLTDLVTQVRHPDDSVTQIDHGFGGDSVVGAQTFLTTVTDQEGKPIRTYEDVRDNVLAQDEMPSGETLRHTRMHYDALGRISQVVEPGGATSTHTYDLLGRRTSSRTPDAGLVERDFDVASNLVSEVTPRLRAAGMRISYTYDHERLTRIDHPDAGTPDVSYDYGPALAGDADPAPDLGAARITHVRDGARDQRLSYDPLGRIAQDTSTMLVPNWDASADSRAKNTYKTRWSYDALGRLDELTYPDGEVLRHEYDAGGLLRRVEGTKAGRDYRYVDAMEYDEFGQERLRTMGNGTRTVFGYDPWTRWLARQVTDTPTREVQDLNYTYDLVGNVKRLDNQLPSPVTSLKGGPGWQDYTYDGFHRLRTAKGTYELPQDAHRDYAFSTSYDLAGNTAAKQQSDVLVGANGKKQTMNASTYATSFTYDQQRVHQLRKAHGRAYAHDANGNSTGWTDDKSGQRLQLVWNSADVMRSADGNVFAYDGDGGLAIEDGGKGTTAFVNDWYTVRNSSQATKHVWVDDDRLASQEVSGDPTVVEVRRFIHADLQGSANIVTDDRGEVYQHTEYLPSGEVWIREDATNGKPGSQVSSDTVPYQYAGGYFGDVGQMTNFGRRWYDPRDGLFTAADPLLTEHPDAVPADPALLPAYTYAESNPVRLVDEQGTNPSSVMRGFFARIGGQRKPVGPQAPAAAQQQAGAAAQAPTGQAQAQPSAGAPAAAGVAAGVAAQPASAGSSGAAVPGAPAPAGQDSRSWARLKRRNEQLGGIAKWLDAYPVVDMTFDKTDDGWKLGRLAFALPLRQWKAYDRTKRKTAVQPQAQGPSAGGGPGGP